ncbi:MULTISPECIES: sporulation membrane protein YtrI [unclassified Virgibacillus]|uniref:sporulation membrane protein YtrI n=1 Tax=unclassified Virgibacillus TaxID=2620237 RepID=UPI0024DE7D30|nr:sporulation membrane protein YtrI [Virgibacillus sp. LDC-1]
MHIPPYYKRPGWQRFFVGVFLGGLFSYLIVMYMYGEMYEKLLENNVALQSEVKEIKKQHEALLKDKQDLNEENKKAITVEKIELEFKNAKQLRLENTLTLYQLEELIKEEIDQIIGQDIQIVSKNDELITSAIENKNYSVDDFSYSFKVVKLTIAPIVKIKLDASISN